MSRTAGRSFVNAPDGPAALRHRANEAFWIPRDADHRTEVHERLIEVEHVPRRHERFRDRPEVPLHRMALGIAGADEDAEENARDVGVENRGALAKRKAPDRAGGVRADALEREQRLLVRRQLPAVAL